MMNDVLKVTLPAMSEGQTDWRMYSEVPEPIGREPWPWWHRCIWIALMWAHSRAESLWHWCWDVSRRFEQPPMRYATRYVEMDVVRREGNTVTVRGGGAIRNGDLIFSKPPTAPIGIEDVCSNAPTNSTTTSASEAEGIESVCSNAPVPRGGDEDTWFG